MADRPAPTPAEAKAFAAEQRTAIVRFAVITFNIPAYWLWFAPQGNVPLAAAISVIAFTYGVYDLVAKPYRQFPVMLTSYWTAVTDGVLITLWIHATGDAASPYFLLWYLSLVAVAFRYDWRATALAALLYSAAYVILLGLAGDLAANGPDVTVRVAYILLVGALGSLLARESTRVFEDRFRLAEQVRDAERFRVLAESSSDALVVAVDGIVVEANQVFCDLSRRTRKEVLGTPLALLAKAEAGAKGEQMATDLMGSQGAAFETWLDTSRGHRLFHGETRRITYQGRPAFFAAFRDITDERAAEEARQHALQADMELQRLREMDHFKGEFINAAAHELNTPLTPLKLELHVLKRRLEDVPGDHRRSLDLLDRNLGRLASLVQDMLDVARLDSGKLKLDPRDADAAAIVRDTTETFAAMAQQRDLRLDVEAPGSLPIVADAKRITQVLDNLVSNALKFTPAGGTVRVQASLDGNQVRIDVTDTGVGLAPDQAQRLFHPFVQVHRDTVIAPGTGLGLYISRGIAERHGGTLDVTSPGPGQGSTFTLRLPSSKPMRGVVPPSAESVHS